MRPCRRIRDPPSRRSFPRRRVALPVRLQVAVEIDAEGVVEDVGRDHQRAEGGEGHDLLVAERGGKSRVEVIGDTGKRLRELTPKLNDELFALVEREVVWILARIEEDPTEKR